MAIPITDNTTLLQSLKNKANNLPNQGTSGGTIDLSDLTVSKSDVLSSAYFIDSNGNKNYGSISTKTSSDITVSGRTVTIPSGYYSSSTQKSVSTTTLPSPSITASGSNITASYTPSTGYVTSSSQKSKTVAASSLDSNLLAGNIKSGVSIFGITGTYEGSGSSSESGSYTDFSSCGRLNSGQDGSSLIIGEIPKIDGKTLKHAAVVCVGSSSEIQLRTIFSIYYDYDSSIGLKAYYYASGGQIIEYTHDTDFMNETTTGYEFIFPTSYYVLTASPAYRYVAVYG